MTDKPMLPMFLFKEQSRKLSKMAKLKTESHKIHNFLRQATKLSNSQNSNQRYLYAGKKGNLWGCFFSAFFR